MSKCVNRGGCTVVLGGHDIGPRVSGWTIIGKVGDVYRVDLWIQDSDRVIRITEPDKRVDPSRLRVTRSAKIEVKDPGNDLVKYTDISSHVYGYDRIVRVGKIDTIRLRLHADSDILTINGTTPWEEPA